VSSSTDTNITVSSELSLGLGTPSGAPAVSHHYRSDKAHKVNPLRYDRDSGADWDECHTTRHPVACHVLVNRVISWFSFGEMTPISFLERKGNERKRKERKGNEKERHRETGIPR
jgi:hypothetical protein